MYIYLISVLFFCDGTYNLKDDRLTFFLFTFDEIYIVLITLWSLRLIFKNGPPCHYLDLSLNKHFCTLLSYSSSQIVYSIKKYCHVLSGMGRRDVIYGPLMFDR